MGVGSDEGTIFVPVAIDSGLLVEPFFRYSNFSNSTANNRNEGTAETVGIGLFRRTAPQENLHVYFGARIAYLRERTQSPLLDPITGQSVGERRREDDGFSVAPTVGVQLNVTRRFAVGGELGWKFTDVSGESDTFVSQSPLPSSSFDTSETRREAHSEIILRFFF